MKQSTQAIEAIDFFLAKAQEISKKIEQHQREYQDCRHKMLTILRQNPQIAGQVKQKCYIQTRAKKATTPEIEQLEEQLADQKALLFEANMERIAVLQLAAQEAEEQIEKLLTNAEVEAIEEKLFLLRDKDRLPREALEATQVLVIRNSEAE